MHRIASFLSNIYRKSLIAFFLIKDPLCVYLRHQSILDYLNGMGERFTETSAAFEREANIHRSADGVSSFLYRLTDAQDLFDRKTRWIARKKMDFGAAFAEKSHGAGGKSTSNGRSSKTRKCYQSPGRRGAPSFSVFAARTPKIRAIRTSKPDNGMQYLDGFHLDFIECCSV